MSYDLQGHTHARRHVRATCTDFGGVYQSDPSRLTTVVDNWDESPPPLLRL